MVWEPFAIAVVFGLVVSAGLYFIVMWPQVEPDDDEPAEAAAEAAPAAVEAAPVAIAPDPVEVAPAPGEPEGAADKPAEPAITES